MVVERSLIRKKKRVKVRFGVDYPKRVAFTGDIAREPKPLIYADTFLE